MQTLHVASLPDVRARAPPIGRDRLQLFQLALQTRRDSEALRVAHRIERDQHAIDFVSSSPHASN